MVHAEILTLRYCPAQGRIDDAPLRALARTHEFLEVREHFFSVHDVPHLACVVLCRERSPAQPRPSPAPAHPSDEIVMDRGASADRGRSSTPLRPDQRALFDALRTWRARRAHEDGVPAYVVLTNRDLDNLVRVRPSTTTELRALPGIGKAKVERNGAAILALLHPNAAPLPAPESEPVPVSAIASDADPVPARNPTEPSAVEGPSPSASA